VAGSWSLPIVAEVVRGGVVESMHHGSVAGLGHDGNLALAVGHPGLPFFGRSSLKPVQALALLRAGLDVDGAELAIVAGSHSGDTMHVAAVAAILERAGLTEDALQCPPDLPLDPALASTYQCCGTGPRPVLMNCSGKHAGMLATCVAAGWPTDTYLHPDHPVQRAIRATLAELTGEPVTVVTVDGCGAPLFAVSLAGLARAIRAIVVAPPGSRRRKVADAMRANPEFVGGHGRADTRLMRAVPGLVAKAGAEGVLVAATPGGCACAVKIADGSARAAMPVLLAALGTLGVVRAYPPSLDHASLDHGGLTEHIGSAGSAPGGGDPDLAILADLATPPVFGGGRRVGEVRAHTFSRS
jgi:L-asparaginase II